MRSSSQIPASLPLAGQVARLRLEPSDALPSDDQFFLNLDTAAALRVLVVEDEGPADESLWVGYPLCTAIGAAASTTNEAIKLIRRTTAALKVKDLAAADVIFLAGVAKLPGDRLRTLEKRVRSGAGLVLFLGKSIDPEFTTTNCSSRCGRRRDCCRSRSRPWTRRTRGGKAPPRSRIFAGRTRCWLRCTIR